MPRRRAALAALVVLAAAAAGSAAAARAPRGPAVALDAPRRAQHRGRRRPPAGRSPGAARGPSTPPAASSRPPCSTPPANVYVGSADRSFVALSPAGRLRWRIRTGGLIDAAAVLGPGPVVTFGAGDEILRRVRSARPPTEQVAGRADAPARPRPARALVGGQPAARGATARRTSATRVAGPTRSTRDGHVRWAHQRGNSVWTTPAVGRDGTTYWGSLDLATFALDRDGRERWNAAAGGYVVASPALSADGRTLYTALLRRVGVGPRRRDRGGALALPDADARLRLAGAARGRCGPRDRRGDRVDRRHDPDARPRRPRALALRHRRPVRSSPVLGRVPGAPARSRRRVVYAGSGDGRLYALDADTGRRRWSYDTTPRRRRGPRAQRPQRLPGARPDGGRHRRRARRRRRVPYDWCLRHRGPRAATSARASRCRATRDGSWA